MKKFNILMASFFVLFAAAANAQTRENTVKEPKPIVSPKKEAPSPVNSPVPASQVQRIEASPAVQPANERTAAPVAPKRKVKVNKKLKQKAELKATPAKSEK